MRLKFLIFLFVLQGYLSSAFIQFETRTKPPRRQVHIRPIPDEEVEARNAELTSPKPRNPVVVHPGKPKPTGKVTTSTTTTTTTTTTSAPIKPVSLKPQSSSASRTEQRSANAPVCPRPSGIFSYRGDCKRFINCWKGRPFVLTCAPGTLFNAATSECDHPYKVKCRISKTLDAETLDVITTTTTTTQAPIDDSIMQRSGQILRLRGGVGPWEGYVEYQKKGKWGLVCDEDGAWTSADASVVCKQLGYSRGVQRSFQGPEFGPVFQEAITMYGMQCSGNESSITECLTQMNSVCHIPDQVVGVRCHREPGSICPNGEHPWGSHCYRIVSNLKTGRTNARSFCERGQAQLVDVKSQSENNFLSDLMLQYSDGSSFHTDGIGIKGLKKTLWLWENTEDAMNFTKWWPGCIVGDGASYIGSANVSSSGLPCLPWDDKGINHVLAKRARSAVSKKETLAGGQRRSGDIFTISHNFCRNPHGESKPWCFVSPQEMEYCDIPNCPGDNKVSSRSLSCPAGQFLCKDTGACLSGAWVCDGDKDCADGSDEQFCQDYMSEFTMKNGSQLTGFDSEKWLHTTAETCARRCSEAKEIVCRSFNHNPTKNECVLTESNIGLSGRVQQRSEWDYYERKVYALNCTEPGLFQCANQKCINKSLECNGKNDCDDRSDEDFCQKQVDFAIRLGGTNKTNEGRVEVRAFGHWGSVCDDMFGLLDANVVCRELGFPLGASKVFKQGVFGPFTPFAMDEVECHGNETSLADCSFSGWGDHDCTDEESVGVQCIIATSECQSDQFRCEITGACIAAQYVCDTVDDCGDSSDEDRNRCQSPVIVRLVDGPDQTAGRVEVRYRGIWGTICDDDFGQEEAKVFCKMLGFDGVSLPVREGGFGPGKGPIWLDEMRCRGNESNFLECGRNPWTHHNCKHSEDAGVRCSVVTIAETVSRPVAGAPPSSLPAICGERPLFPGESVLSSSAAVAKVVRGEAVQPGFLPWQVGIRTRHGGSSDTQHWCGATVLTEDFIITAAHCLSDFKMNNYVMRVGDHNTEIIDPDEEEFGVEAVHVYDLFGQGAYLNHDLALVKIKRKRGRGIPFGDYIQPICLPGPDAEYKEYMNCTIAGWGSSGTPGSGYAIKLQSATVPILPNSVCRADHVYGKERIQPGMLCSGFLEGGVDSCQGDSGGSLICEVGGRPTIMGITSWGFGCGKPNKPGVYTKVTNYLDWIYSQLKQSTGGT